MSTPPKRLILIDGSGFIFRAFHALPPMQNHEGTPVNAVYGFTNMLLRYLEGDENTYRAVIFDAGRQTFRNDLYALYKAHRVEVPQDLIPQFALIRAACKAFNICAIEKVGFEADDLIATYATQGVRQGMVVTIVSSDKDLMQLVSEHSHLWDPLKGKKIGIPEVMDKFGVHPPQVAAVQALAGDASDNIPGVPGIGPKTATALIQEFQTLENLYAQIDHVTPARRQQLLRDYQEQAFLSQKLTILDCAVPIDVPIDQLQYQSTDTPTVLNFLNQMNFKSLITRLQKTNPTAVLSDNSEISQVPQPISRPFTYDLITTAENLEMWVSKIKAKGIVAFDTETTSLNPDTAELVGISLSVDDDSGCYIPISHVQPSQIALNTQQDATPAQLPITDVLTRLNPVLQDPRIIKVGHNIKYDCRVLQKYDVTLTGLDDTMLMSYVCEEGLHNLDALVQKHFGHTMLSFKEVLATVQKSIKSANFSHVSLDKACYYAVEDAVYTLRLYYVYKNLLEKAAFSDVRSVYEILEKPLIPVICAIEQKGVYVDVNFLQGLSQEWGKSLETLEQQIYAAAGHPFLIGSPKQLATVLFDELNLQNKSKKGKSGAFSTGADVLEDLAAYHPLPQLVLQWRQLAKLKNTYTDSLVAQINPLTQRIHTAFSMAGTTTGRLASSDPNLQNIPIRTEEGKKIRHAFQAEPGYSLISADYSQIELRLLTHFADVPHLRAAFTNHQDIHSLTAAQIFGVPLTEVTSDLRRQAKAINFGIIYGISSFGLAKQLGISARDAAAIIKAYFIEYPGINTYMESMVQQAQRQGYVSTLYGRRCFIPGIHDKNAIVRSMSQRQAINAPLQGSNADIIKHAMVRLPSALTQANLQAKMILQVHDELIFEAPESEVDETCKIVKKLMENVTSLLEIPLIVEIGVGKTWESAH